MKRLTPVLALLCFCFTSQTANACSVCFGIKEETLVAFYVTTALLTFLPFIVVGAFIYYIRRRLREMDSEECEAS